MRIQFMKLSDKLDLEDLVKRAGENNSNRS